MPVDHPTIANDSGTAVRDRDAVDRRERLWDRRSEIAADPFQILYQKIMRFVRQRPTRTIDRRPSTIRNVSGSAVAKRDPPIRDKDLSRNRGMNANSVMRVPLQTRLLEHSGPTR